MKVEDCKYVKNNANWRTLIKSMQCGATDFN